MLHNMVIYGGTFDPVHNGHVNTAINIQHHFNYERFIFLPCKTPVLKTMFASTAQRVKMLELALANYGNNFIIDHTEINSPTPSYMVETLQQFRHKYGQEIALSLIIGSDHLIQLPKWYEWQKLIKLCHLVVINRHIGKFSMPKVIKELVKQHQTYTAKAILELNCGLIYKFDAGFYPFSSTEIRKQIAHRQFPVDALPLTVLEYIQANKIYHTI